MIDVDKLIADAARAQPSKVERTPRTDRDATLRRARAYVAKMDPAVRGSGGHTAALAAASVLVHKFGLSDDDARRVLVEDFNPRCEPPWEQSEIHDLERKVDEARKSDQAHKWPPVEDRPRSPNDPVPSAGYRDTHPEPVVPSWCITPATAEWITDALPPREHLLVDVRTGRGAMDRYGTWLVAGAGGAGKSYSIIDLMMAVARGGLWLGTFQAARSGNGLIIAAEDSIDDIRRRVHAIGAAEGYPPDAIARVHVLSLGDRVTSLVAQRNDVFSASADTLSLCAELAARDPYDLVVVDPYGRIAGVSVDSDNAAAAATISALAMIAAAARGLVLGVTHTSSRARLAARAGSPEGATGVRGATGQGDYARGVLQLERDESDHTTLKLTKANHVAPWEPVVLRRGDHGELIPLTADERAEAEAERRPRTRDEKAAAKERDTRERDRLDDVAARQAIGEHPGASARALLSIVRGARACGQDRASAAVSRVRLATESE